MRHKSLWNISLVTTPEAEDAVAELLSGLLNLPAATYHDLESSVSTVAVYLPHKLRSPQKTRSEISSGLRRIRNCGLKTGSGKIVLARVRPENWAESWKRHFKPIEIGNALLIKPSWSKRKPSKGQTVIVLDPGLSFGTGHHPTTAFCLDQVVQFQKVRDKRPVGLAPALRHIRPKPPSFLDLGTGSGILAIAAAKLRFSPVVAMDFDREAVRVARTNARVNRVGHRLGIRRGDVKNLPVRPRRQYDLVCANLISDLLLTERHRIAAQLNPAGTLVLAGILKPEFRKVENAYKTLGFRLISHRDEKEWRSGSFRFARSRFFERRHRGASLI